MEKITVDLIAHKEFSISSKGYDQAEVDNFLDDICEEMERMEKEIVRHGIDMGEAPVLFQAVHVGF